ncbi:hypothetical protein BOW52_04165, partial [Solemya elarraichensis gill symbiont]
GTTVTTATMVATAHLTATVQLLTDLLLLPLRRLQQLVTAHSKYYWQLADKNTGRGNLSGVFYVQDVRYGRDFSRKSPALPTSVWVAGR